MLAALTMLTCHSSGSHRHSHCSFARVRDSVHRSAATAVLASLLIALGTMADPRATWSVRFPSHGALLSLARADQDANVVGYFSDEGSCIGTIDSGGRGSDRYCLDPRFPAHVVPARDGRTFIFGTLSAPSGVEPAWVGAFDAQKRPLWANRYPFTDEQIRLVAGDATPDGGLVLVGGIGEQDRPSSLQRASMILKLSAAGRVEWARRSDVTGYELFTDVRWTGDGFVILGSSGAGLAVTKVRPDGSTQWQMSFAGVSGLAVQAVFAGGDVIVAASTVDSSQEGHRIWIARISNGGAVRWQRLSNGAQTRPLSIDARADGSFVLLGVDGNVGELIAVSAAGAVLWDRVITLSPQMRPTHAIVSADGGVLVATHSTEYAEVHKFSATGEPPPCLLNSTTTNAVSFSLGSVTVADVPVVVRPILIPVSTENTKGRGEGWTLMPCQMSAAHAVLPPQPVTTAQQNAASVDQTERAQQDELSNRVIGLLRTRRFAELDALAAELRTTNAAFAGGLSKLYVFYYALAQPSVEYGTEDQHLQLIDEWRRASPRSVAAAVAAAEARIAYAFRTRGSSFSNVVTAGAMERFRTRLSEASRILADSSAYASVDPEYQVARVSVAGAQCDQFEAIVHELQLRKFAYLPLWRIAANFLLPRWCGNPSAYRAFAEYAANATRDTYGPNGVYALLAFDALRVEETPAAFKQYDFSWPRIRQGFMDLIRRFPANHLNFHRLAYTARFYEDRATVREMFGRPEIVWTAEAEPVWGSYAAYDESRRWMLTEAAAPVSPPTPPAAPQQRPTPVSRVGTDRLGWIAKPGSQWPTLFMTDEIRLKDGTYKNDLKSFLVTTTTGVVAISALTNFATRTTMPDMHNGLPPNVIYTAAPLDTFRAQLTIWTMSSPENPGKRSTVVGIQPSIQKGGHSVILTLDRKPDNVYVFGASQPLKIPDANRRRVFTVTCEMNSSPCHQVAITGTISGGMMGSGVPAQVTVVLDDAVPWTAVLGSPVFDESAAVLGVISGPEQGYNADHTGGSRVTFEEINGVLAKAGLQR